jgi:hypothetical protein
MGLRATPSGQAKSLRQRKWPRVEYPDSDLLPCAEPFCLVVIIALQRVVYDDAWLHNPPDFALAVGGAGPGLAANILPFMA